MQEVTGAETTAAAGAAIEARDFSFAYPGAAAPVLAGIDWRVEPGEFQLLVGSTGCGKTTLMRCAVPSLAPAGERTGSLEASGFVGYVDQNPANQVVCDTVWHELAFGLENMGVPQAQMRRRVAEVAHFFGIAPWFRRRCDELSGGQQQIVVLAAALALRPSVLLLDEPTSQLDPVAEKNFAHALFRVNRELGITVVVCTHAPEAMAEYATSAVRLGATGLEPAELDEFRGEGLDGVCGRGTGAGPAGAVGAATPAVRLDSVFARYSRAGDWILRGFDLSCGPGGIHALVGSNGCGKSTLLKVIAGVLKPERGRVDNRLRASQALLPQNPKALLVCDSVAEELREWQKSCGYTEADIEAAMAEFGLVGMDERHPYDLSGGQQQLLAFAKLALTRPKLLLLDEPTKGLDPAAEVILARAMRRLARDGVTLVVSSHDLALVALLADTVTLVFDGESACDETAAEFFDGNIFYRPLKTGFARRWLAEEAAEATPAAAAGEGA